MNQPRKTRIHIPSAIALIIMLVLTVIVSTWPGFIIDRLSFFKNYWWVDFSIHGFYYFLMGIIFFPLFNQKSNSSWWFFPIFFLISIGVEMLQYLVPGRNVSLLDIGGNFTGLCLAVAFSYWGRQLESRRKRSV